VILVPGNLHPEIQDGDSRRSTYKLTTNSTTARSRSFTEKLIIAQLVNNLKFHLIQHRTIRAVTSVSCVIISIAWTLTACGTVVLTTHCMS
jgi:hypothetical protein